MNPLDSHAQNPHPPLEGINEHYIGPMIVPGVVLGICPFQAILRARGDNPFPMEDIVLFPPKSDVLIVAALNGYDYGLTDIPNNTITGVMIRTDVHYFQGQKPVLRVSASILLPKRPPADLYKIVYVSGHVIFYEK